MNIDIPHRVAFLKKIHLFHGLDDDQITAVAQELGEESFETGNEIIHEGQKGDKFYLIYSGNVDVNQKSKHKNLGTLVVGDYFGEEALLLSQARMATVTAQDATTVFFFARDKFLGLIKKTPKLKINFEVSVASRRLARQKQFKWLEPGEVIYFLARKHQILLWQALTAPVLTLILPVILLVIVSWEGASIPKFAASALLVLAAIIFVWIVGVIIWRWIDWGNDYYIVTNARVIWLEKVVAIYDNRQEAPLSTVLSVGVQTDQLGRWLDYGDVIIRTFVGKIMFHHVHHPNQAAALVEEHWGRAKLTSRKVDMEAMKQTIRQKFGLAANQVPVSGKAETLIQDSPYKPSALATAFSNVFKLRYEVGGTVTYRKHWIVLVENIWQPTLLFLIGLGVIIWRVIDLFHTKTLVSMDDSIIGVVVVLLVPLLLWWIYQYLDWSNDIYQVTDEQILDILKKPLGKEERKAAPLDNILTTEAKRVGIFQMLWNYGDVNITVGGTQLVFEDVRDPSSVQQDLDRRRLARLERKKQTEVAAERERVADWFVTYHDSSDEIRRELEARNTVKPEDDKVQ